MDNLKIGKISIDKLMSYYSNKQDIRIILKSLLISKRNIIAYGIQNKKNDDIYASLIFVKKLPGKIISDTYFKPNELISLITNAYTEEDQRNKGYMKILLKYTLYKERNRPIYLKVSKNNLDAQNLYEKFNFVKVHLIDEKIYIMKLDK